MMSDDSNNLNDLNLENDECEDEKNESPQKKRYKSEVNKLVNRSVRLQIQNNLSNKALSDVVKFANDMPNAAINIPKNNSLKRCIEKDFEPYILLECERCHVINKEIPKCANCDTPMKKDSKKNNFLVHFSLKKQINRLLDRYFDEIIAYINREHTQDMISDVDDGAVYKKINAKYANIKNVHSLFFSINADGAAIFNSSTGSMWPVQLYAHFLPPKIRYLKENIILSTVYYGKKNQICLIYFTH